jgi:hypothetical protein
MRELGQSKLLKDRVQAQQLAGEVFAAWNTPSAPVFT